MGFLKNLEIVRRYRFHRERAALPRATTIFINGDTVYTVGYGNVKTERLPFGFWAVNQNLRPEENPEWLPT